MLVSLLRFDRTKIDTDFVAFAMLSLLAGFVREQWCGADCWWPRGRAHSISKHGRHWCQKGSVLQRYVISGPRRSFSESHIHHLLICLPVDRWLLLISYWLQRIASMSAMNLEWLLSWLQYNRSYGTFRNACLSRKRLASALLWPYSKRWVWRNSRLCAHQDFQYFKEGPFNKTQQRSHGTRELTWCAAPCAWMG